MATNKYKNGYNFGLPIKVCKSRKSSSIFWSIKLQSSVTLLGVPITGSIQFTNIPARMGKSSGERQMIVNVAGVCLALKQYIQINV
jgi:hypothetical protein